jgi:hypothetical protein
MLFVLVVLFSKASLEKRVAWVYARRAGRVGLWGSRDSAQFALWSSTSKPKCRPATACRRLPPRRNLKVTGTLPFALKREHSGVVYVYMNMETTNSAVVRVSRFFSDRYAYRTQPGYLSELVAFGMIVFIAVWPIILVAQAMAVAPR